MSDNRQISVLVSLPVRVWKETVRWQIDPVPHEGHFVTLLARLNQDRSSFLDFHIFRRMERRTRFFISQDDPWLKEGRRMTTLLQFCGLVKRIVRDS
jgi:hypothetical protein